MLRERTLLKIQIESVKRSRKDFSDYLDRFDSFYSKQFIIDQFNEMNKYQKRLEDKLEDMFDRKVNPIIIR